MFHITVFLDGSSESIMIIIMGRPVDGYLKYIVLVWLRTIKSPIISTCMPQSVIFSSFCFRDMTLKLVSTSYFCWTCLPCELQALLAEITETDNSAISSLN